MLPFQINSTHEKYTETYQHWCSQSETYAGGDHLISAFRVGWELANKTIHAEQDWKSGNRSVTIYHFVLVRNDEMMTMPVITNPFIERYLIQHNLKIVYGTTENATVRTS